MPIKKRWRPEPKAELVRKRAMLPVIELPQDLLDTIASLPTFGAKYDREEFMATYRDPIILKRFRVLDLPVSLMVCYQYGRVQPARNRFNPNPQTQRNTVIPTDLGIFAHVGNPKFPAFAKIEATDTAFVIEAVSDFVQRIAKVGKAPHVYSRNPECNEAKGPPFY